MPKVFLFLVIFEFSFLKFEDKVKNKFNSLNNIEFFQLMTILI